MQKLAMTGPQLKDSHILQAICGAQRKTVQMGGCSRSHPWYLPVHDAHKPSKHEHF
jgi:hypothetical protein